MGKYRRKTRFVGVRLTEEQLQKLLIVSQSTISPGNMSEGIRALLDMVPINSAQFCGNYVVKAAFVLIPSGQPLPAGDGKTRPADAFKELREQFGQYYDDVEVPLE